MKELLVRFPLHYPSYEGEEWRQTDYSAWKCVQVIKGEPMKGYVNISSNGTQKRYDKNNQQQLVDVIAQTIGSHLSKSFSAPTCLVPVPCSDAVKFGELYI